MSHKKNLIVPVFIPHLGCPHRCVFCNQAEIAGSANVPSPAEVLGYLSEHLGPDTPHAVAAFYGGSFTGLPKAEQEGYLAVAGEFVVRGFAKGIRLSTRPDYVDMDTARFLLGHGVLTVELGVQSMDDGVLAASGRGHNALHSVDAASVILSTGIELGVQIMAGLPGDTAEKFASTVDSVVSLTPSFVRIYPTLVVKGSPLEALWRRGGYNPLGLEEAVGLCATAVKRFREAGINVVRVGLQPSRELEAALLAGPYHPAFGHLVESEIALERMREAINKEGPTHYEFIVNPSELSVYKGIKGANVSRLGLFTEGADIKIRADAGVEKGELTVKAQSLERSS